ncbi:MAG: hypothetical protein JW820_10650, partial [Spirochaetales bacterium]|nr:hypothetical protein [Spirochaetales bacterium]
MKKYVPILLSLLVLAVMSCATVGGDEKIKDTVEDIRKKEAEAEKKRKERREREGDKEKEWRCENREEDRDDSRRGEGGANLAWLEYVASIRFAAYPYAPSSPYAFST